ncbi:MAG: alpha/beta hydrolase [Fibrobacter sp.]|jgi:pimeloyl-ACP methyl ester carboxylesterase|nr:alpha/beta hydrolase [Fibrobacter sp.]
MNTSKKKKIIFGVTIGLVLLIIGSLVAIPVVVMNSLANMHVDFNEVWTAEDFGIEAEHFFVTTDDNLKISAFEVSTENPKAIIICISGIHNPSATVYFGHACFFKENNYATIVFDMRAHGESEGDMICLGYKEYLDTKAIVKHIKADSAYKNIPVVIFGLSMGATTAINSIGEIPEIDALISLSAFSSWEDVFYEFMASQSPVFLAKMVKPFVPLVAFVKYRVNVWSVKPVKEIKKLGNRPALIMHSTEDSEVPYANFERIINNAPSHVKTFVREGDIHSITESFTEPEKDKEYSAIILDFLDSNFSNDNK